jgi:hypothetical protein
VNKREKFLLFVYLGALARDASRETTESERITDVASRIPERRIPPNALNAAKVYLAVLDAQTRPHRWMFLHR